MDPKDLLLKLTEYCQHGDYCGVSNLFWNYSEKFPKEGDCYVIAVTHSIEHKNAGIFHCLVKFLSSVNDDIARSLVEKLNGQLEIHNAKIEAEVAERHRVKLAELASPEAQSRRRRVADINHRDALQQEATIYFSAPSQFFAQVVPYFSAASIPQILTRINRPLK